LLRLPFISSPIGLVPKHNSGWRRIQDISYPPSNSVNKGISSDFAIILYTTLDDILAEIVKAGQGCLIIKRDIKDAFRNVLVALDNRWLLGFY